MRGKIRTWTDSQLLEAIARCTNFTDVIRALGLRAAGGNHYTVKRHAKRLNADTSHFTSDRRLRGIRGFWFENRLTDDDVFRSESRVSSPTLRKRALRCSALPYCCALCGNSGTHNGKPLTLQLDHANGIYNDNRVENLRWLCPNCHSQTETFAGRRSRHGYRIMRGQQPRPRVSEPGRRWGVPTPRPGFSYVLRPAPRPAPRGAGEVAG